jgi:signal peptidase
MKRFLKRCATACLIVTAVLVVAVIALPSALGLQRFVITGGSMTGAIDKGSVIYSRITPVADLKVGDIITFVPPGMADPVTHRILSITPGPDGALVFQTKGDFNAEADPWRATFVQSAVARYQYHVPYAGYALAALALREVRIVALGLPALAIALSLLSSLWAAAGAELRRREREGMSAPGISATADAEAGA